jgi:Zn-dependent oligopeptidase
MALEKFAYSKTFLATVTAHWKTGAPPPDALLSAAVQINRFQQGVCVCVFVCGGACIYLSQLQVTTGN